MSTASFLYVAIARGGADGQRARREVLAALAEADGRLRLASVELGISPRTMSRIIARLDLVNAAAKMRAKAGHPVGVRP